MVAATDVSAGMALRLRRVRQRLSIWQLAREANVNPGRLSEAERDMRPLAPEKERRVLAVLEDLESHKR